MCKLNKTGLRSVSRLQYNTGLPAPIEHHKKWREKGKQEPRVHREQANNESCAVSLKNIVLVEWVYGGWMQNFFKDCIQQSKMSAEP